MTAVGLYVDAWQQGPTGCAPGIVAGSARVLIIGQWEEFADRCIRQAPSTVAGMTSRTVASRPATNLTEAVIRLRRG